MLVLITYDLKRPGQNYSELFTQIKKLGNWAHPLESTWLVQTDITPEVIRNRLVSCQDANDRLLVTRCTTPAAWSGTDSEMDLWLQNAFRNS